MKKELTWTGERMTTDFNSGKGSIEHLHRYAVAMQFVKNKIVLDLASGEGYGSNLMAELALSVIGVDISKEAVEHATNKYKRNNLKFLEGSATVIPLNDNSVDVIVSYETLEHLTQHDEMLIEFKRVLTKDGLLFISTPERENYKKIDPNNPFHLRELSINEFKELLKSHFLKISLYHQRFFDVSFIYPENDFEKINRYKEFCGNFDHIDQEKFDDNYYFNIAICTNNSSHSLTIDASFFNGSDIVRKMHEELIQDCERRVKETVEMVRKSTSYKIGNSIIKPFSIIKEILKK